MIVLSLKNARYTNKRKQLLPPPLPLCRVASRPSGIFLRVAQTSQPSVRMRQPPRKNAIVVYRSTYSHVPHKSKRQKGHVGTTLGLERSNSPVELALEPGAKCRVDVVDLSGVDLIPALEAEQIDEVSRLLQLGQQKLFA